MNAGNVLGTSKLTKADFVSDQEVRWCPGCGDYAILAAMLKFLPELDIPKEKLVFISGIGCSGRFPYYLNTYGFHTIHGRAPAVATGLRLTRPDLSVWLVTGDGDGLSIGANHLLHLLRRNVNVKVLLFNNQIYGLTKGQYSPTSEQGKVTQTTPYGALDKPLSPIAMALSAGATFVARVLDIDQAGLNTVLKSAATHRGSAFIEIYQNCNIFNDGAFAHLSDKAVRKEHTLWLEHGKPLVFGQQNEKGIALQGLKPHVVNVSEQSAAILQHDAQSETTLLAHLLSQMAYPHFPVVMGVFRSIEQACYEDLLSAQQAAAAQNKKADLRELLYSGQVWKVD